MKKIITILLLGIFLISFSSAFGEIADFNEDDGKYGSYKIESGWGFLPKFLGGGDLGWVKLTENTDECLINCHAKGEGYFHEPKNFLDGLEFKNRLGEDETELGDIKILIGQLEEVIKQNPIYEKVCEDTPINYTNSTNCYKKIVSYEDYTEEEMIWKEYKGEDIFGDFEWEIKAKKSPDVSVDWIVTIWGERLEEWAWWDGDWSKKREISNLTGNISALFSITWDSNMKSDFSDLRFLDNATESIELNYTIEKYTASTNAVIRVNNLGASSIMMYYGNPSATSNSNASNVYYESVIIYYFDEDSGAIIDATGNVNATNNGATYGAIGNINKSLDFDGSSDYVKTNTGVDLASTNWSLTTWFNPDATTGADRSIFSQQDGTGTGRTLVYIDSATGKIATNIGGGVDVYGSALSTATWYHVVAVYDDTAGTIKIYLDSSDLGGNSRSFEDSTGDLVIGIHKALVLNPFNGRIDETKIFKKTLSQEQISSLFNETAPLFIEGDEQILGANIKLISPTDALQTTQTFQTFRCNASFDTNIANLTFQLNGADTFTNSTTGTFIDLTYSENLTQGIYNWSCRAETVSGLISQSNNRTLTIHITTPGAIFHNPEPLIDYHLLGNNLTLNWTITETGENLTEHIKNCTYEYNGVLTILNNTLCTQINNTEFEYVLGVNNLTFNVTDILDLVNSTLVEWDIKVTEINQTYSNTTTEGSTQDISAEIRLGSSLTISAAVLDYNGTLFAGVSTTSGENEIILKSGLITPNVEANENITFHWSIILSGGEIINLSEQNQTIINIGVDNCSTFTNKILNMTMVDEEMQTSLSNTVLEIALNIFSEDRTTEVVDFSNEFDNINPVEICLNLNISEGVSYSVDSIIRYTATDYANEYYNIVDYTLNNNSETQNLTLYDLNLSDSTDFQLTFTGEDFLPVENALVSIERQYISENTFKTVELPKTDSNGQTILHLVRNDVIYNILVTKDGVVLGNFQNVIAFCEDFTIGACSLPLNAISNVSLVFDYDDEIGLIFQQVPQYNDTTKIVSFSFSSTDGTTKLVEMSVERRDVFGNRTVCENAVLSSSGTVSCQVSQDITDTSLATIVSVDGEDKVFSEVVLDDTAYGQNGYSMFFIFAIATLLMFSGSKTWTLVGISVNYIFGVSLGFIIGGIAGAGTAGILVLVISMLGIWQLNKGRKQ